MSEERQRRTEWRKRIAKLSSETVMGLFGKDTGVYQHMALANACRHYLDAHEKVMESIKQGEGS